MRSLLARVVVAVALIGGLVPLAGAPARAQDAEPVGQWIAGDFHVHTTYSHDSYGGPDDDNTGHDEFYTAGLSVEEQFTQAAVRGLDFLTISDHNDVRSQTDSGWEAHGLIGVPAYENSLKGHAQMIGAERFYDSGDQSVAAVQTMADELRADGGAFQVNHPAEGSTDFPHDTDWDYGYDIPPDTVEVWNISRLWQPPMPSASSNDDAVRYWEGWLDRGYRPAATGGSDSHWASTSIIQGAGQPTTWVYVTDLTWQGIAEGLRAGRTFISHQPPAYGGPKLFLEGDSDGDGTFDAMVGDAVKPGTPLRARVIGAPGSLLRIVTDGGREAFAPVPVLGHDFEHRFVMPEDATWVRAEIFDPDAQELRSDTCDPVFGNETTYCRNMLAVLGMTSAMFFEHEQIATTLTYTGETHARGETVDLEATLTDVEGNPVAGRTVTFAVGSQTVTAVTDSSGVASAMMTIADHGRSQTVTARFAGDSRYLPSDTSATITWGGGRT